MKPRDLVALQPGASPSTNDDCASLDAATLDSICRHDPYYTGDPDPLAELRGEVVTPAEAQHLLAAFDANDLRGV